jgi:hypothetical protein
VVRLRFHQQVLVPHWDSLAGSFSLFTSQGSWLLQPVLDSTQLLSKQDTVLIGAARLHSSSFPKPYTSSPVFKLERHRLVLWRGACPSCFDNRKNKIRDVIVSVDPRLAGNSIYLFRWIVCTPLTGYITLHVRFFPTLAVLLFKKYCSTVTAPTLAAVYVRLPPHASNACIPLPLANFLPEKEERKKPWVVSEANL